MQAPETSTTLLRDLSSDANHVRWTEFVARYRPMMEAYMRERFPALEADDIIQETLIALSRVLLSYDYDPEEKGAFHNYVTGILRNKAMRVLRKRDSDARTLAGYAGDGDWGRPGDRERRQKDRRLAKWRRDIFKVAFQEFMNDGSVSDRTKRIFECTAIKGESPEAVAAALKMTRHAVDQAKSRAMSRLREKAKRLEAAADV